LSHVRLARASRDLNQVRIDTQQADALLACDLVVGASAEALQTMRRGHTRVLANVHAVPVAQALRDPDADNSPDPLLARLRLAAGDDRVETFDAQQLAETFLGDTVAANMVALGYAWQRALVPVGLEALLRALELNGVAVELNRVAFALGRCAAADAVWLRGLHETPAAPPVEAEPLDALIARAVAHLAAYQDAGWARRFEARVHAVRARETALGGDPALPLTRNVARSLLKLMSYKDEYEVARLFTDGAFARQLAAQFDGDLDLEFHIAPPLPGWMRRGRPAAKVRVGGWLLPALKLLARGRFLRGTAFDVFGHTNERRTERALIGQFELVIDRLLRDLDPANQALAAQIAALPLGIRGFGHVKAANLALARAREAELLHRFSPQHHARPDPAPAARQLRGIAIVAR
jgi:indolepyruvate ferredoxin oxidoreductase